MNALLLSLTLACTLKEIEQDTGGEDTGSWDTPIDTVPAFDADADGYTEADGDCDDLDADINPGASELCDEIDNNCDGSVDEGVSAMFYGDADGDGFGDPALGSEACAPPLGHSVDDTDCDDLDPLTFPGATEVCDEMDNDCDGTIDENVTTTYYADNDGDGAGASSAAIAACSLTPGYSITTGDCDDTDPMISPFASELCDGFDNNCDGVTDDDAVDTRTWYFDDDGDGYGSPTATQDCLQPSGYVSSNNDCDDTDVNINPGISEVCDGFDNNCNGWVDANDPNVTDASTWYADADGDGYGSTAYTTEDCAAPTGYVADNTDCDDTEAVTYPGADELCDEVDNNCDTIIDENPVDPDTFYRDFDGDGYGDEGTTTEDCEAPTGYVADNTDCADTQLAINPGAAEECNDKDDDCDELIDDDDPDVTDARTWFLDADNDGYGSTTTTTVACDQPSSFGIDSTDCDDTDSDISPGANEVCDQVDNDCDTLIDDDDTGVIGQFQWYSDSDNDGFGNSADVEVACTQPSGRIANGEDCDDTNRRIHPGVEETCDAVDQNCDGNSDEGLLGSVSDCAGANCQDILEDGSSDGDGLYWIDPVGDGYDPQEAYCDMTSDDGGWTRVYASLYPTWWSETDWSASGDPEDDDYSILSQISQFSDDDGAWTMRLVVGNADTWDTSDYDYATIWSQEHDPISDSSDGSDYTFIDGDEPTTCDGFTGLHSTYYDDGGTYALVSDPNDDDDTSCWGMQIIPLEQYGDEADYAGYVDGYSDGNTHVWQVLWVR